MKNRFIKDLQVNEVIEDVFYVEEVKELNYKSKPGSFLILSIKDKSGITEAKIWDPGTLQEEIRPGTFVKFKGRVVKYNDNLELHIDSCSTAAVEEVDPQDFLPASPYDVSLMVLKLKELISTISNPHLHLLLATFLKSEFFNDFCKAPAAKVIHQPYVGGLLEHSLKVAEITAKICELYDDIDRDLAVTGALLHDIGKIYDYTYEYAIDITTEGRLLGHIIQGVKIAEDLTEKVSGFPADLKLKLKHIILSHHGQYEWQSPVLPQFVEAYLVHMVDLLEADLWKFRELKKKYPGQDWSPWEEGLGRKVYLK